MLFLLWNPAIRQLWHFLASWDLISLALCVQADVLRHSQIFPGWHSKMSSDTVNLNTQLINSTCHVCVCVGVGALPDSLLYLSLSHANDSFSLEACHVYIIFSLCPPLSERLQCVTTAARLRWLVSMVTQRRAQKWWAGHCKKGGGGADVAWGTQWPHRLPALCLFWTWSCFSFTERLYIL